MCGICGVLAGDSGKPERPGEALLERMNQKLVHRGPDSGGVYLNGRAGLAMRRLAVIDVAGGEQPIFNEDGTIALTYNGEIYNFGQLRSELERHGHQFATKSDTEVIVHAYEEWGDDSLLRLNGMFAFALWDTSRQRLLLARDRMGQKPLYWHYGPRGLLWASEAKSLLAAPWVDRRVNPVALHHYLTLQYTPDPLTIFEDIHQLPAAHKLVLKPGGEPEISRWWQLEFEPKWMLSDEALIEGARQRLSEAVRRRLVSEVPLGVFLSGGIDSSVTVALMSAHAAGSVKTFSMGFKERGYSEARYARQVAEMYETEHREFTFSPESLTGVLESIVAATDEPLADPAALPLYELARETRRHVTVALCGDGGDETLGGYTRYALDAALAGYAMLPRWLTQRAVPSVLARLPEPAWLPEDRSPLTGLRRLQQFAAVSPSASIVRWGSYFGHDEKLALYGDRWREEMAGIDTAQLVGSVYDEAIASRRLDRTLHADHSTYLAGDLLPKTDRVTMAHGLEARAPFLDPNWVEWTARLPVRAKVRGRQTKWLLHAAFRDMLPREVCSRGKQGFSVPVGPWLRGELRTWCRDRLLDNGHLDAWFRPEAVRRLIEEHEGGRVNHGKRLWALLTFAVWSDRFSPQ